MQEPFILYNDTFYNKDDSFLTASEQKSLLFTSYLKLVNTKTLFWDEHLELIGTYLRLYGVPTNMFSSSFKKYLARQVQRSYVKNKLYKTATICMSFFWIDEQVRFMIEYLDRSDDIYPQLSEFTELIINEKTYKSKTFLSSYAIGCKDLWSISEALCVQEKGQVPIIIDTKGNLLEVPNANLFIVTQNKQIITPCLTLGVYRNPAFNLAMKLLTEKGITVEERTKITSEDLKKASEVFFIGDICGVQEVVAFEQTRYYRRLSKELAELFTTSLIE